MTAETVFARGHRNVTALHPSTFEVTRDPEISTTADCIIAVSADKGAAMLSEEFRRAAADEDAIIMATITCAGLTDVVKGWGSAKLTFTDDSSMVFRVSDYVCGRTVMVNADKPAARLNRKLVDALARGNEAVIELKVEKGKRPQPSLDLLFEGI
ncbi:DUF371 domain-containing protein [Methanocella arvoryzae]|uniref:DUF371 domain-containing protein n=1 Tax=Methanocella arvoryzae (strain DSM 22066 / NBRC 105507 / MRE50) TaxID=351160 RepID=Q0W2W2_METAR|nr:DUF371 domain-containing protein [Methanocella arvoryzae]CAJ37281.1 conserved hypothetical protein [Methanocella arvoryzae MRE50]